MPNELRTEVEQVKQQEEVKRALKQTSYVSQGSRGGNPGLEGITASRLVEL